MAQNRDQAIFPFTSETEQTRLTPMFQEGVFRLSTLTEFCRTELEPRCVARTGERLIIDVTGIVIWDISALLWFALALQDYWIRGLSIQLELPDEPIESRNKPLWKLTNEEKKFCKSGDFLRRWKFGIPLSHICALEKILVPEQVSYFNGPPRRFYLEGKPVESEDGTMNTLLTNRLAEIHDFTRIEGANQLRRVSPSMVEDYVRKFSDAYVWNVIAQNCDVSWDDAQQFVSSLIAESLDNMHQHPNASSGFIAISVLGNTRELIISVADNGDSISQTILNRYNDDFEKSHTSEKLHKLPLAERFKIIDYATHPYVTSKTEAPPPGKDPFGLGLHYIREASVKTFRGKLRIVTMATQIVYSAKNYENPERTDYPQAWRGNLIRISIPLRKGRK